MMAARGCISEASKISEENLRSSAGRKPSESTDETGLLFDVATKTREVDNDRGVRVEDKISLMCQKSSLELGSAGEK